MVRRSQVVTKTLLVWTLACGVTAPLSAQRYNFRYYGLEDGLANQVVRSLLQDRAGFIWVGTENGLFRYDGGSFFLYSEKDGLPDTWICGMAESSDGILWVASRNGISRFDGRRFLPLTLPSSMRFDGESNLVSSPSGSGLYVTSSQGIGRLAKDAAGVWRLNPLLGLPIGPASGPSVAPDGTVWFGCGRKVCSYHPSPPAGLDATAASHPPPSAISQDKGVMIQYGQERGLPAESWDGLLADRAGAIWARNGKRLFVLRPGQSRFEAAPGFSATTSIDSSIAMDSTGTVLVPADSGLMMHSPDAIPASGGCPAVASGEAKHRSRRPSSCGNSGDAWRRIDADRGLNGDSVASAMEDREGSLWIGMSGMGLARWRGYRQWEGWGKADGLANQSVWSIQHDSTGATWAGSAKGLYRLTPGLAGTSHWKPVNALRDVDVRTIAPGPDGALWTGSVPGGIRRVDPATGAVRVLIDSLDDGINSLAWDTDGALLAATDKALYRIPVKGTSRPKPEPIALPGGPPRPEEIDRVLLGSGGIVWVAGTDGLAYRDHGAWRRLTTKDGLRDNAIYDIAQAHNGDIWIAYRLNVGAARIRRVQGRLVMLNYQQRNGLSSDNAMTVGSDSRGWIWVETDRGVDVLRPGSGWRHYGQSDGLIWDDCDGRAFLGGDDGAVWIGTSKGVSRFQPFERHYGTGGPPVAITAIHAGSHEIILPLSPADLSVHGQSAPFKGSPNMDFSFAALTLSKRTRCSVPLPAEGPGIGLD